jgi:hypothetical protein
MPKITWPNCGNRGLSDLGSEDFEARGQWEAKPVRKCCGAGMRVGFGFRGPKTTLIDSTTWRRMEELWNCEFCVEEDAPELCSGNSLRRGWLTNAWTPS